MNGADDAPDRLDRADRALRPHPRLYAGRTELERLRRTAELPLLQAAAKQVAAKADEYVRSPKFDFEVNVHNALLRRARHMQQRVLTLLVRWLQTDDRRYRDGAVAHIAEMGEWEYWSWLAWRRGDPSPDAEFDLSYGENSLTLAVAYDWLAATLSRDEERRLLEIAQIRALRPFLAQTERERPPFWFGQPDSNWNTVCSGGAGALALATHERLPEAPRVSALAERSIVPFFDFLRENAGGWPEGIGYWNYGMRYAFIYLLSHEHATGRPHPLMERPETRRTLSFPFDFCPNRQPCSFGDVNSFHPMPFHYAAAARLGEAPVMAALDAYLGDEPGADSPWPDAAELLLLHPGERHAPPPPRQGVARLYEGMGWGLLADRMPGPRLYLSARGGTTAVSHSHLDLLSFHCVVGDEALVNNLGPDEYLDTTFGPRRHELFEIGPPSKNTVLINGVGITAGSSAAAELVEAGGLRGLRLDATAAMGESRDGPAARFCGRLLLMLRDQAILIVDRVELPYPGRVEARLHTRAAAQVAGASALLIGQRQRLCLAYACDVPAVLRRAEDALTTPSDEPNPNQLRWCTKDRTHTVVTMATLLVPGEAATVELSATAAGLLISAGGEGWGERVDLDPRLHLVGLRARAGGAARSASARSSVGTRPAHREGAGGGGSMR